MSTVNRRSVLRGGLVAGISAATVGTGLLSASSGASADAGIQGFALQEGWRWCRKCQGLFYFGSRFDPHFGRCPAGGAHTTADSHLYYFTYNNDQPPPTIANSQFWWRHCRNCMGLSYNNGVVGWCPGAGRHDHTGSHNYYVRHDLEQVAPGQQESWRWCDKCQGIFYGPGLAVSACPKSGQHRIGSTSFNYVLEYTD